MESWILSYTCFVIKHNKIYFDMFYSNRPQHLVLHDDLIWYYRTKHNIAYLQFWWKHQQIKTRSLRRTPWERHTSFFTGFPPANNSPHKKDICLTLLKATFPLVFHLFFGHLSELLLLLLFWGGEFFDFKPSITPWKFNCLPEKSYPKPQKESIEFSNRHFSAAIC